MKKWLVFLLLSPALMQADQIPPAVFKMVVALGHTAQPANGQPGGWVTEASGFFYGFLVQSDPDPLKRQYRVFLVTNRHVLVGHDKIEARLDPDKDDGKTVSFMLPLKDDQGHLIWYSLPDASVDISVANINTDFLASQGLQSQFISSDIGAYDRAKLKENGCSAGDTVFVLGFPMSITGVDRNYVITRKGSIARISDFLAGAQPDFTIDALIFPGNSGGPVFSGLEFAAITGTKSQLSVGLVGVIRGYIPYIDVAVSQQTLRPRITFEENSGLADVIPVDRGIHQIESHSDEENS